MAKDLEYYKKERNAQWRKELRSQIKAKDRTARERVKMPEQEPLERIHNFLEVNLGLDPDMAVAEAQRCLDCPDPTCVDGCPVHINIPKFVKKIEARDFLGAVQVIKESNTLPAVCGRVCPQEEQCENNCFYNTTLKKPPIAIGYLERFAADFERHSGKAAIPEVAERNGIKVASVGSGPAALAWAADMARNGYEVHVFEALHEIGGVLKYGIPEFRLPNEIIDFEIDNLRKMGVQFHTNFVVGKTATFDELRKQGFKAFFIASGAGLPRFMGIPGENSINILSANEYLTRVNLMHGVKPDYDTPVPHGKRVAVIGAGNTAMDAVRTAKRLGAEHAYIIYRRSRQEMPARVEEIKHAEEEGVEFIFLANPVKYIADEKGHVKKIVLEKMQLGEPDASGRRRPIPTGETFEMDVDVVVLAIGLSPNPLIPSVVPELETTRWGTIVVNDMMQTSVEDMFAGGDIIRGGATVILAMGDGRKAAAGMHKYLKEKYPEHFKK